MLANLLWIIIAQFTDSDFVIKDQNKKVIARGRKRGKLYVFDGVFHGALSAIRRGGSTLSMWHQRLGHPQAKSISLLKDRRLIDVTHWLTKPNRCISCQMGKSCKLPFNRFNKISEFPLDKIHYDLWGPAPIASNQFFRYYVVFVDDFSCFTCLYPLRRKSKFFECFIKFQKLVENQLDRKIKVFQCDGGGEFGSTVFLKHLSDCGIRLQISCLETP